MAPRYSGEFRRDPMRIAATCGLTRPQVSSDLGGGLSTSNKWVRKHQHDDLMSGPHEDVEKQNERLRKDVRQLREAREVLNKGGNPLTGGACLLACEVSLRAKIGEVRFCRYLERSKANAMNLKMAM